jgi:hypothetical protein
MKIPRSLRLPRFSNQVQLIAGLVLLAGAMVGAYQRNEAWTLSVHYGATGEQASVPSAPQELTAIVAGNTVTLNWLPPASGAVTSYLLEAALTPSGTPIASLPVPINSLTVPNVPNGTYFVRVRAVNLDGAGAPSNEVIVIVPGGGGGGGGGGCTSAPNAPQNLTGTVVGSLVSLNWSPAGSGCAPTGYILLAGSGPSQSNVAQVNTGASNLSANAPPGTYYIRTVATSLFGASGPSNEIALTVQSTCSIPAAPVLLAPSVSGTTVNLSWLSSGGSVTGYIIEAGSFSGGANLLNTMTGATGYSWSAPAGTAYIRVKAMSACGTGPASNQITATVAATPTPPPTSPSCGPRSAPCGTATAVCRDGTLSCSQNRSGTCSSHGGVSCWICPGRLCSGIEAAALRDDPFFAPTIAGDQCGV